ncbi:hypothetical protein FNV43_RR24947 [Rhamnella rubrinervis]|uniref:Nuclear speckle splicing regulatory protein 1 N-terminal domain-containing protein n=1 Tax=Rhamnella rubrinervis TaxID=2594499 RepID=A0A8K0DT95_9ROSA|nr:hypothetical protein FNV43_RR24947 [Rhamnella rubrinervis]
MSKYGLNLRAKKTQQPTRPPLPTPSGFGDDDDDDVEREISRHASKNKSLKEIEDQQRKALEEDPSVFDYDGVYDEMKEKASRPKQQEKEQKKPKYIENLLRKKDERQREQEIIYDRKLAKERSKEDHLYADKDKFVTSAYKRKLAEQAKWVEEERLRQLREEKEDVTKKTDLTDFYFNLDKNVAFGARDAELRKQEKQAELRKQEKQAELRKQEKHGDEPTVATLDENGSSNTSNLRSEPSRVREDHRGETSISERSESSELKPVTSTALVENSSANQPQAEQPKTHHHKRSEDAVAAAKERFLARKKAKEQ